MEQRKPAGPFHWTWHWKRQSRATVKQNAQASAQLAILLQDFQAGVHPPPSGASIQCRAASRGPGQGLKLNRGAWTDQSPVSSGAAPRATELTWTTGSQLSHLCFPSQWLAALGWEMAEHHPHVCAPLAMAWPDAISHGATATPGTDLLGWRKGLCLFCLLLYVNLLQDLSYFDMTPIPHLDQDMFSDFSVYFFPQSLPGHAMRKAPEFIKETCVCWLYGACKRYTLKAQTLQDKTSNLWEFSSLPHDLDSRGLDIWGWQCMQACFCALHPLPFTPSLAPS